MIKQRDREHTLTRMEPTTTEHGLMINNMEEVSNHGLMVLDMKDFMKMERRKAMADLLLLMEVIIRVNLDRMRSVDLVITTGQMVNLMQVIGVRTKWMV